VFPEKELCVPSPNLHIHVFVSDLYILRIGPLIFLQQSIGLEWKYWFHFGILSLQCINNSLDEKDKIAGKFVKTGVKDFQKRLWIAC
jgi:hypothetical protein